MPIRYLFACFFASAAIAAEIPADFDFGMGLRTEGRNALYRLELPAAVYRGIASSDLADFRVFNANGEVVPHAFRPRNTASEVSPSPVALKYFPIYGEETNHLHGLTLDVQRTAGGSIIRMNQQPAEISRKLRAYLIDASAVEQPMHAFDLDVRTEAASTYVARVTLEISDDLSAWTPLVADAPLVSLERNGERLELKRIAFTARRSKYFRISWFGMPEDAVLAGVHGEFGNVRVDALRSWESVTAHQEGSKPGDYLFDVQGHFPIDRIRFELPQQNTLAQFQLLARNRPADAWHLVGRGLCYRLNQEGGELKSPPLAITAGTDRYWLLRIDQKGGGLGSGTPLLFYGWVPHELVFSARGDRPFSLAFGNREAKGSAYAIESLVPNYKTDAEIDAQPAGIVGSVVSNGHDRVRLSGVPGAMSDAIDLKQLILWLSLGAGVLFLAWMAWRLSRQMKASSSSKIASSENDSSGA